MIFDTISPRSSFALRIHTEGLASHFKHPYSPTLFIIPFFLDEARQQNKRLTVYRITLLITLMTNR